MARIAPKEEIERIRGLASIASIVGAYVQLKPAGIGAKKGLCPFHDEKTPSFTVRENTGTYHCFGCGESGDVFAFVMKLNGVDFPDALEDVAAKSGTQINWKEVEAGAREKITDKDKVHRARIIEANELAAQYYMEQLLTDEAKTARDLMKGKNFIAADCELFGVGYAPRGKDNLVRKLGTKGFTQTELDAAGLITAGQYGAFDRFQGRLIWPIRDEVGDVIGFTARQLYDDDFNQGKYINTSETKVFKKSKVLYGIDLARKPISKKRQVVLVEGQTDVMAMHLAGVDTAVAASGTSFTEQHLQKIRRLMGDIDATAMLVGGGAQRQGGKIIYTFDGDSAGLNAAVKAFAKDQAYIAQTYVAIVPEGKDPCDLRIEKGDIALRNLVDSAVPMFEFAIRTILKNFDTSTPEGRVGSVRAAAPIVADIRDISLRPEYTRMLAMWTGLSVDIVLREVQSASRENRRVNPDQFNTTSSIPSLRVSPHAVNEQEAIFQHKQSTKKRSPEVEVEMNLIAAAMQYPNLIDGESFIELEPEYFNNPFLSKIFERIVNLGGVDVGASLLGSTWLTEVSEGMEPHDAKSLSVLATTSLPVSSEKEIANYTNELMKQIHNQHVRRLIDQKRIKLSALQPGSEDYEALSRELMDLSAQLQSRTRGGQVD